MKIVILAGGGGTRLFPLSRSNFPKQFLKINADYSLLSQTIRRYLPLVPAADLIIVTNTNYESYVKQELVECGAAGAHVLVEPAARNTAPAIVLAARYCMDQLCCREDEVIFIAPSDHYIQQKDEGDYETAVKQAVAMAAQQKIIIFGVSPTKPETGYGYICLGQRCGQGYLVDSFREKPDQATAEQYVQEDNYLWNSGMYVFTIRCLREELQYCHAELAALFSQPFGQMTANFNHMPNISFDYAVAEKSHQVVAIPLNLYWNDIGSWDSIYEVLAKDGNGNAIGGDCILLDCRNTLMLGHSRLIAGLGLEDMIIVETEDVILVAPKNQSQKVKELVAVLKARGRRETEEYPEKLLK